MQTIEKEWGKEIAKKLKKASIRNKFISLQYV